MPRPRTTSRPRFLVTSCRAKTGASRRLPRRPLRAGRPGFMLKAGAASGRPLLRPEGLAPHTDQRRTRPRPTILIWAAPAGYGAVLGFVAGGKNKGLPGA